MVPVVREDGRTLQAAREEEQPVLGHHVFKLFFGEEAAHGGAVLVDDMRARDEDGGPAALPGADADIEVVHVGGTVDFVKTAEGEKAVGLEEAAAAAAVEDPCEVFAFDGKVA